MIGAVDGLRGISHGRFYKKRRTFQGSDKMHLPAGVSQSESIETQHNLDRREEDLFQPS